MAYNNDSGGRMTGAGARKAMNFITDLLRGRKAVVTFYLDEDDTLRELGTRKEIEVRNRQRN